MLDMISSEILTRISDLFFSRTDVYARSWLKPDGTMGYSPSCGCRPRCMLGTRCPLWVPERLSDGVLTGHLTSTPYPGTIGSYTLSARGEAKAIILDIDAHGPTRAMQNAGITVRALCEKLEYQHVSHYLELSGRGYHIWIFTDPIPAELAYKAGRSIVDSCQELVCEVEVYPKQSQIPDGGFGNLIKIPYGLHWTGTRCLFLDSRTLEPLQDQWGALMGFERTTMVQLQRLVGKPKTLPLDRTLRVINNPSPTGSPDGLLPGPPCVTNMFKARLSDGEGRNQTLFQLAIDLQRAGILDPALARSLLLGWNNNQIDPLSEQEFDSAINHAYNGSRYSYGCNQEHMDRYCEPDHCPIAKHAEEGELRRLAWKPGYRV